MNGDRWVGYLKKIASTRGRWALGSSKEEEVFNMDINI